MPTPKFKKTVLENEKLQVSIYVGAVNIKSKTDNSRRHLRIVEKPIENGPGVLFTFKKLTIQVQAQTFENLIQFEPVQNWFLECCEKYLLENNFSSDTQSQASVL